MKSNAMAGMLILFLSIFAATYASASSTMCQALYQTAKQFTVNGQSDIPDTALAVANQKRVWLYSAPDERCKTEGLFVIADDVLRAYKRFGEYTYISFTTVKGKNIPGWVNTSAISDYSPNKVSPRKNALSDADFIVVGKARWFGLGSSWSRTSAVLSGREIASGYIGDFPNEVGGLDKFTSHEYKGLSVVSSNINYDKRLWGIDDDYIIQAIKVTSVEYKTMRGIRVGDALEDVHHAYSGIAAKETPETVSYVMNEQILSFTIANGRVTSVELTWFSRE
mgnify:CR=1 FL=1